MDAERFYGLPPTWSSHDNYEQPDDTTEEADEA
jgi:hypothetical protein